MSKQDLILDWVSERGEGSWSDFRAGYDWLIGTDRPDWQTPGFSIRMLSTLGHLEIDWAAGKWAAAPAVLTILPNAGARALLTGGRTRELRRRLHEAIGDNEDLYPVEIRQQLAPTAVWVECADETHIVALANELGLQYEYSVAERLSELLPALDSYLALVPSARCPKSFGVERLDPRSLRWISVQDDTPAGLYRYESYGPAMFRLVDEAVYAVDWAVGVYAALSRWGENRLRYIPQSVNGVLCVPLAAPLPTLQARTAALCCGLAPQKRGNALIYRNVPEHIARRIARSLDQSIPPLEASSARPGT